MIRAAVVAVMVAAAALVFTVPARAAARPSPQATAYAWAVAQHGKPFVWAGTGPGGFDCSGLVYAAYRHAGIRLPRDTVGMVHSHELEPISPGEARRGDLAFYGPPGDPEHVAMVDTGNVVFSAYRPGEPAGWSVNGPWWHPNAWYRVTG